jgi:hypothetical protein
MGNEVDDPMGVLVGELLYQHAVDDREDRGRRRDADAERANGGGCQRSLPD